MKIYEKEDNSFRKSICLEKSSNDKLIQNDEFLDHRAKSIPIPSNELLKKYIPKLKPLDTNINPSPIILKGEEELKNEEKKFSLILNKKSSNNLLYKFHSEKIEEEERNDEGINSNDEENYIFQKKNINKNNMDNYINITRKKLDRIKNEIKIKKYKDDSNSEFIYDKNNNENYRIKCIQKFFEKLRLEKMEEYEKCKNKTISFKDMKLFKPPILEFLEMNNASSNANLSTRNLTKIL